MTASTFVGVGPGFAPSEDCSSPSAPARPSRPKQSSVSNFRMIAVSPCCPPQMRRLETWDLMDYVIVKQIGSGATSTVHHAICKRSNMVVALKVYKKRKMGPLSRCQVQREIQIHTGIQHDNIVHLYGAFEDDSRVILVMEFANRGDLFDEQRRWGGKMKEKAAVCMVLLPFMRGISHLHSKGIVHRDIKPENILLNENKVLKIADFGLAIDSTAERPVTRLGTLDYMAPEVLVCPDKELPEQNKGNRLLQYGPEVDAWGVGVLAYELIVGRPPFGMSSQDMTMQAIMAMEPRFPEWVSEACKDFILKAVKKLSAERSSVREMMQHPFITSNSTSSKEQQPTGSMSRSPAPPHLLDMHRSRSQGMIVPPLDVSAQRVVSSIAARSAALSLEDECSQDDSQRVETPSHPPNATRGRDRARHISAFHSSFGSRSQGGSGRQSLSSWGSDEEDAEVLFIPQQHNSSSYSSSTGGEFTPADLAHQVSPARQLWKKKLSMVPGKALVSGLRSSFRKSRMGLMIPSGPFKSRGGGDKEGIASPGSGMDSPGTPCRNSKVHRDIDESAFTRAWSSASLQETPSSISSSRRLASPSPSGKHHQKHPVSLVHVHVSPADHQHQNLPMGRLGSRSSSADIPYYSTKAF